MKTILVTGCAGFIASNFCDLFKEEMRIIGVDCFGRGSHPDNVSRDIIFRRGDIASSAILDEILEQSGGVDGIINFAAESHVDHSLADDTLFWSTNVLGVRNLAKSALKRKIRLLQVSTDEVYGPSKNGSPATEDDRCHPRNPYAASKAAADLLLMSYHHSYGLDCVITRGANTVGPRQSFDKLVPKAVYCFLVGRPFPLYRTPAKRMWLGAEDHCRAILKVFQDGKPGAIYNVSPDPGNEMETGLMVERIRELVGQGEIQLVDDRAAYDLRYLMSSDRIHSELNWSPKQTLEAMIRDTINWYRNHPEWIESHPGLVDL